MRKYGEVGDHVFILLKGRVAKKKDGKIVPGKFISFSERDLGIVVGTKKVNGNISYMIRVNGGEIPFQGKDLCFVDDNEEFISSSDLRYCDHKTVMVDKDISTKNNPSY